MESTKDWMQVFCLLSAAGILLIGSIQDIRKKTVSLPLLLGLFLLAGIAIVWQVFAGEARLIQTMLSLLPGAFFLLMAVLSGQKVGVGDGWILLGIGVLCGAFKTILAVFLGLLFCGITAAFLMALKKATWKTRLPFLPFLSAGWAVTVLAGAYRL